RYTGTLEGHGGPFWYYALALPAGCAPWCVFFALTAWHTLRGVWTWRATGVPRLCQPCGGAQARLTHAWHTGAAESAERPALQFLLCWIAVYFLFFSASRTKLPNYVLPLYPAVALLTGRFLDQWRRGEAAAPGWLVGGSLACLGLIGAGAA